MREAPGGRSGDVSEARHGHVQSVELDAERPEKLTRPRAVGRQCADRTVLVHPAGSQIAGQQPAEAHLSGVALAAQPAKVVMSVRPPECGGFQSTGHVDGQPVVKLVGRPSADLAHRLLELAEFLTECNAVCVEAVLVPRQDDGRGRVSAPAADAAD